MQFGTTNRTGLKLDVRTVLGMHDSVCGFWDLHLGPDMGPE